MRAQQAWIKEIYESYGGRNRFHDFFAAVKSQIDSIDEEQMQETQRVSRVLHAHLMTECFLTRYLQYIHPDLKTVHNASLSYSQKIDLIDDSDRFTAFLIPGLRCLETMRKRLAYDPPMVVTDRDKKIFLSVPLFKGIKEKLLLKCSRDRQEEALSIMECFATFAGIILCNASGGNLKNSLAANLPKKSRKF